MAVFDFGTPARVRPTGQNAPVRHRADLGMPLARLLEWEPRGLNISRIRGYRQQA
jgi:hypothetical protein